jgi:hypothetical protein
MTLLHFAVNLIGFVGKLSQDSGLPRGSRAGDKNGVPVVWAVMLFYVAGVIPAA